MCGGMVLWYACVSSFFVNSLFCALWCSIQVIVHICMSHRDLQESRELCCTTVTHGGSQLSINPLNWKQMCVMGLDRLTLYSLEQCDNDHLTLTSQ